MNLSLVSTHVSNSELQRFEALAMELGVDLDGLVRLAVVEMARAGGCFHTEKDRPHLRLV